MTPRLDRTVRRPARVPVGRSRRRGPRPFEPAHRNDSGCRCPDIAPIGAVQSDASDGHAWRRLSIAQRGRARRPATRRGRSRRLPWLRNQRDRSSVASERDVRLPARTAAADRSEIAAELARLERDDRRDERPGRALPAGSARSSAARCRRRMHQRDRCSPTPRPQRHAAGPPRARRTPARRRRPPPRSRHRRRGRRGRTRQAPSRRRLGGPPPPASHRRRAADRGRSRAAGGLVPRRCRTSCSAWARCCSVSPRWCSPPWRQHLDAVSRAAILVVATALMLIAPPRGGPARPDLHRRDDRRGRAAAACRSTGTRSGRSSAASPARSPARSSPAWCSRVTAAGRRRLRPDQPADRAPVRHRARHPAGPAAAGVRVDRGPAGWALVLTAVAGSTCSSPALADPAGGLGRCRAARMPAGAARAAPTEGAPEEPPDAQFAVPGAVIRPARPTRRPARTTDVRPAGGDMPEAVDVTPPAAGQPRSRSRTRLAAQPSLSAGCAS